MIYSKIGMMGWLLGFSLFLAGPAAQAGTDIMGKNPYGEVSLPFELHQVPDKPVYYVIGISGVPDQENQGHTSNAGFVVTDEGVVVFDALGTPALGYELLRRIRQTTDKPIKYVVVSHYHADHIYGLQAFDQHARRARVIAQNLANNYVRKKEGLISLGEAADRRLKQRREALSPWVDEETYLVPPDKTFEQEHEFTLGGLTFRLRHMGPAHAPADSIMLIPELKVLFSGDVIYKGRIPFLDSAETDSANWLAGLEMLAQMKPRPEFVIPGHGEVSQDVDQALEFTQNYIQFLREKMGRAVENFMQFEQAYTQIDWSEYEDMPAFDASNRGNAYRIYLEMEASSY